MAERLSREPDMMLMMKLAAAHREAVQVLARAVGSGRGPAILTAYRTMLVTELALLDHSYDSHDRMVADSLRYLLGELDRDIASQACRQPN